MYYPQTAMDQNCVQVLTVCCVSSMANQEITAENGKESTRASNYSHISCGTFIPFFALDSEYLKSLLIGKG